jgi:hypothetical protein
MCEFCEDTVQSLTGRKKGLLDTPLSGEPGFKRVLLDSPLSGEPGFDPYPLSIRKLSQTQPKFC